VRVPIASHFVRVGLKERLDRSDPTTPDDSSVDVYDFEKHALSRVTSEKIDGKKPQWLPTVSRILFTGYRKIGKRNFTLDVHNFQ
jgi:hypothetical protein